MNFLSRALRRKAAPEQANAPAPVSGAARAKAAYARGKELAKQKDFPGAVAAFEEAFGAAGENAFCRIVPGRALRHARPEEAEAFLRRSVEIAPDNADYLMELAAFLVKKRGDEEESLDLYQRALAAGAKPESALSGAGQALMRLERFEEAAKAFTAAINAAPGHADSLGGLAKTLLHRMRFEDALPHARAAVEAAPGKMAYAHILADVYTCMGEYALAAEALRAGMAASSPVNPYDARRAGSLNQMRGIFTPEEQRARFFAQEGLTRAAPRLSGEQQRILRELEETGIAFSHADDLLGEDGMAAFRAAVTQAEDFRSCDKTREEFKKIAACDDFAKDPELARSRPYIIYFTQAVHAIRASDAVTRLLLRPEVLDVANGYLGMLSKLCNVNIWVNPPLSGRNLEDRIGSQKWHRDQEDDRILKCFIYLTEVDENSGALDYIPRSRVHDGTVAARIYPHPWRTGYPPQAMLDAHLPPGTVVTACRPKYGIAFVDTSGFHRGGRVSAGERVVMMGTFLRPTSPGLINDGARPVLDGNEDTAGLAAQAVYALS